MMIDIVLSDIYICLCSNWNPTKETVKNSSK